jgi:hypothetical protein
VKITFWGLLRPDADSVRNKNPRSESTSRITKSVRGVHNTSMSIFKRAIVLTLAVVPAFAGNASNYTYLALGDSVSFGYDPTVTSPTPSKYTGYPEVLAGVLHLEQSRKEVNASCPGQTSGSFLIGGPDNGCQQFKDTIGLHTNYTGTQSSFAVTQLESKQTHRPGDLEHRRQRPSPAATIMRHRDQL